MQMDCKANKGPVVIIQPDMNMQQHFLWLYKNM